MSFWDSLSDMIGTGKPKVTVNGSAIAANNTNPTTYTDAAKTAATANFSPDMLGLSNQGPKLGAAPTIDNGTAGIDPTAAASNQISSTAANVDRTGTQTVTPAGPTAAQFTPDTLQNAQASTAQASAPQVDNVQVGALPTMQSAQAAAPGNASAAQINPNAVQQVAAPSVAGTQVGNVQVDQSFQDMIKQYAQQLISQNQNPGSSPTSVLAQQQLQKGNDAAIAANLAAVRSQTNYDPAAMRTAQNNIAAQTGQNANQAAALTAQQQVANQGTIASLLGQGNSGALGTASLGVQQAGQQASIDANKAQTEAQLGLSAAQGNQSTALQAGTTNAGYQQAALSQGYAATVQTALQNGDWQQATNLANNSSQVQATFTNASLAEARAQLTAQLGSQASQFNAAQINQMATTNLMNKQQTMMDTYNTQAAAGVSNAQIAAQMGMTQAQLTEKLSEANQTVTAKYAEQTAQLAQASSVAEAQIQKDYGITQAQLDQARNFAYENAAQNMSQFNATLSQKYHQMGMDASRANQQAEMDTQRMKIGVSQFNQQNSPINKLIGAGASAIGGAIAQGATSGVQNAFQGSSAPTGDTGTGATDVASEGTPTSSVSTGGGSFNV